MTKDVCGAHTTKEIWSWIHVPAVPRGKTPKFHCPWKGTYRVKKVINDVLYHLQHTGGPRRNTIVHFDRLKPYHLGGSQTQKTSPHPGPDTETTSSPITTPAHSSCKEEEEQYYLAASPRPDAEQVLRRSTRQTRPPDRYGEFVTHNLSTRTWISKRGSSVTKTRTLFLTELV